MDTSVSRPHSHLPYGEEGSGFYSENTKGCFQVIEKALPLVLESLQFLLPLASSRSFLSIGDFGACDGGTSSQLWKNCFEWIQNENSDISIWLHYEDQATNDWKSLFSLVHGLHQESNSMVALKKLFDQKVFITACGTSFFESCYPPYSLDLIFSATAMHWLSSPPKVILHDSLHCSASKDEAARNKMKQQAASDWERIILHRERELRDGGRMVLVNLASDDSNQFLGSTSSTPVQIFDMFYSIWNSMSEEGIITKQEVENTCFANYYRTLEEIQAPFKDETSLVYKQGLRIVSSEIKKTDCLYKKYYLQHQDEMTPSDFASWYVPTLRTWSNSTFINGLQKSRSKEEKNQIVDELFARYQNKVEENPLEHGMDYVHSYLVVKKIQTK